MANYWWQNYRLRTLLIAVFLLGSVLAILTSRMRTARQQKRIVGWVLANDGEVEYEWQADGRAAPSGPVWLRRLLGDDFFQSVRSVTFRREQVGDLSPISELTTIRELGLAYTSVSDLSPLRQLIRLRRLNLWETSVSDLAPLMGLSHLEALDLGSADSLSDISPLRELINLRELNLSDTPVADVSPLGGLTELRVLDLSDTLITDITALTELTNLRELNLTGTGISEAQISRLEKMLPNCNVTSIKSKTHHHF